MNSYLGTFAPRHADTLFGWCGSRTLTATLADPGIHEHLGVSLDQFAFSYRDEDAATVSRRDYGGGSRRT